MASRLCHLPQGSLPDYNEPVIIPRNKATVEDFCNRIHKARCRCSCGPLKRSALC